MIEKNITIAITSCGRFESLKKTILSIENTIDLSLYKKVMTEDSKDRKHIEKIKKSVENWFLKGWKILFTFWSNQTNLYKSHHYALKILYDNINTKYVFHCEDDQIFKKTNFDYLKLSYEILENEKSIGIVLLRDLIKDFWLKKTGIMKSRYYEILTDEETSILWHDFIFLNKNENFTLQPWLRRTNEMKKIMFWHEEYVNEKLIWERYNEIKLRTIVIKKWIYNHINPILNSTKNIKNLWVIKYIYSTINWTIRYRLWLLIKYIKNLKNNN